MSRINNACFFYSVLYILLTIYKTNAQRPDCSSRPCNKGKCYEQSFGLLGYYCICDSKHKGYNCDIDKNGWKLTRPYAEYSNDCLNGATFIQSGYPCLCRNGFSGNLCEIKPNYCKSKPCKNDALCKSTSDTYQCYCFDNYYGERCEYEKKCLNRPCQNGGTCFEDSSHIDGYTCKCQNDYSGINCQIKNKKEDDILEQVIDVKSQDSGPKNYSQFAGNQTNNTNGSIESDIDNEEVDWKLPCLNGGEFYQSRLESSFCRCPFDYLGYECNNRGLNTVANELAKCSRVSCSSQSVYESNMKCHLCLCNSTLNGYKCRCPGNYAGERCEKLKNFSGSDNLIGSGFSFTISGLWLALIAGCGLKGYVIYYCCYAKKKSQQGQVLFQPANAVPGYSMVPISTEGYTLIPQQPKNYPTQPIYQRIQQPSMYYPEQTNMSAPLVPPQQDSGGIYPNPIPNPTK